MTLEPADLRRFPEDLEFVVAALPPAEILGRIAATLGFSPPALARARGVLCTFPPPHQREMLTTLVAILFRCEAGLYARALHRTH